MKQLYKLAAILAAAMLASLPFTQAGHAAPARQEPLPFATPAASLNPSMDAAQSTNQIIIKFRDVSAARKDPKTAAVAQMVSEAAGSKLAFFRKMSGNAAVFQLNGISPLGDVEKMALLISRLPDVEYAEPDMVMQPLEISAPNDSYYAYYQWDLWGTYGLNMLPAWNISTGSNSVVVAVIDTGILPTHPEILGRTVPGYDFISYTFTANDGDGRDADPSDPGDWLTAAEQTAYCPNGSNTGSNSSWHGTHVAGTIAANSNNGVGMTGINWNSKILPVRVLGKCGGYTSDIADAIRWAAGLDVTGVPTNANPAKVLNLSLGGGGGCSDTYQTAIDAAVNAGASVVVAAGNSNMDAAFFTPANCSDVITVAATGPTGLKASYSNFGSMVEIAAPGGDYYLQSPPSPLDMILSLGNDGTQGPTTQWYYLKQGTSMAAPHVTGVVSLLYSVYPFILPAEVLNSLQTTVKAFPASGTCTTSNCGSGIIDAGAAVAFVATNHPQAATATATAGIDTATASPTDTPTATASATATATSTATASATPTATALPTDTATETPTNTSTATPTDTATSTPTATATASPTMNPNATATRPPAIPSLVSVVNGGSIRGLVPLKWKTVSGVSQYQVQISLNESFSPVEYETTVLNSNSITVSTLTAGRHFWRVRSVVVPGVNYSGYSSPFSFKLLPPAIPVLISPSNNATTGARPNLTWGSAAAAVHYHLQVFSDAALTSLVMEDEDVSNTSAVPEFQNLGTYYWRVRSFDPAGNPSSFSSPFKFTSTVPAAVSLLSPAAGASVTGPVSLSWAPINGVNGYNWQVDKLTNFSSPDLQQGTTTQLFTQFAGLDAAPAGTTWYWRVQATDALGNTGAFSAPRAVMVKPPAAPAPSLPKKGATLSAAPILTWKFSKGAAAYEVQVDNDPAFATPNVSITGLAVSSYDLSAALLVSGNQLYYWRVRAVDAFGNVGPYSAPVTFILK